MGLASVATFLTLTLLNNKRFYDNYCAYGFDFGVYLEVIKRISQGEWNPFIYSMQRGQLNDHSDPIFYLLSWTSSLMPLQWSGWLIEAALVAMSSVVIVWLCKRQFLSPWLGATLACYLFFSRDLYEATFFPIHTSTFAILPAVAISTFIATADWSTKLSKRDAGFLFVACLMIALFKQPHSMQGLGLGLALLLLRNQRKLGGLLVAIFLPLGWFLLKGRALVVGPLTDQLSRVPFSPESVLALYGWDAAQASTIARYLASLIPLAALAWCSKRWRESQTLVKLFLLSGFFGPYLLGQVLSGSFNRHYNTMLIAYVFGLSLILVSNRVVTKKLALISCAWFAVFSISKFDKAINLERNHNFVPMCVRTKEAYERIGDRNRRLAESIRRLNLAVGASVVSVATSPNLVAPLLVEIQNVQPIQFGHRTVTRPESLDWFLIEKGDYGYDLGSAQHSDWATELETLLRASGGEVIVNDRDLFFARGPLPVKAISKFFN